MPLYVYICNNQDCPNHEVQFEVTQKIVDEPLVLCEVCDQHSLERIISSRTSFILSGHCWAKDGYAKPKPEGK